MQYEVAGASKCGEWLNLHVRVAQKQKVNFRLGWNGLRFSRSHDLDVLCTHLPALACDIAEWVERMQIEGSFQGE